MEFDRYDAVLVATPMLAVSGSAIEAIVRLGGGPGVPRPIEAVPLTFLGLLAACTLIGHELFTGPIGGDDA